MTYVLIVILLILAAGLAACNRSEGTEPTREQVQPPPESKPREQADSAELARRLAKLRDAKPPKKLQLGAMCYDMAPPPDRTDYVCPVCGERTLYANPQALPEGEKVAPDRQSDWEMQMLLAWELPACRRHLQAIRGLDVSLDESEFCQQCQPRAEQPALTLVVKHGDQTHRVRGIRAEDLQLITEFLDGKQVHDTGMNGEKALKDYLPRLQELLGVKLD